MRYVHRFCAHNFAGNAACCCRTAAAAAPAVVESRHYLMLCGGCSSCCCSPSCAGWRAFLLWTFAAIKHDLYGDIPWEWYRMYRLDLTLNPILIMYVMHPREFRACAEPKRALAGRGQTPLLCIIFFLCTSQVIRKVPCHLLPR